MSDSADEKAASPKTTSVGSLQTSGGAGIPAEPLDLLPEEPTIKGVEPKQIIGRSPGQLAWLRLKRDRVALVSAIVTLFFVVIALLAPLIETLYGDTPTAQHAELISVEDGLPIDQPGGISADHWLGIEPGNGRDLLLQLAYGARTSLGIAIAAALISTTIGVVVGITAAYFGGWIDSVLTWFTDFMLAFPFFLFCLAAIPVLNIMIADDQGVVSTEKRIATIIGVFAVFGWMSTARLVRGQVLSLREREFVEAARAAGASSGHILFRQLLPNLWAPILVTVSLGVPQLVTAEAALSFLNIGVIEPTPDWGRMIFQSIAYVQTDPLFTILPGMSIFILVLAFNLFGDSLRDALDPKSLR